MLNFCVLNEIFIKSAQRKPVFPGDVFTLIRVFLVFYRFK